MVLMDLEKQGKTMLTATNKITKCIDVNIWKLK